MNTQYKILFKCPKCGVSFEKYGDALSEIHFGTCQICGYNPEHDKLEKNNNDTESFFKKNPTLDSTPNQFEESIGNPSTQMHKTFKPPKKSSSPKVKISLIVFIILSFIFIAIGMILWSRSSQQNLSHSVKQNNVKTQEDYLIEFAEYATVTEYIIKSNTFDEKIVVAKVQCPDYKSIYSNTFEKINSNANLSDKEIPVAFFSEVSKLLKDNYETTTMEITMNLSDENYEKTENDSWSNDEITILLAQQAAVQAFDEFCIDQLMEYAPEITEEGLLGEPK